MKHVAKKLLTLALGVTMVGTVFALGACGGHTHTAGTEWKSDATSHWHVCTKDGEVLDKADHVWNAGTVTKEASYIAKGEKAYTCTVCSATKKEDIAQLKKTGTAELEGGVNFMGTATFGAKLTVDFDSNKAAIAVYSPITGVGEMVVLIDKKDDTDWTQMMAIEIGKADMTESNGTYKANWSYEATNMETQEAETQTAAATVTLDAEGNIVSGEVNYNGIAIPVVTEAPKTATLTAVSTETAMGGLAVTATTTLSIDLNKNEAVLTINYKLGEDMGGMAFDVVAESGDSDTCMYIGKGAITKDEDGTYKAIWTIPAAEEGGETTTYEIKFSYDKYGYSAAIAFPGILAEAVTATSTPVISIPAV